MKVSEDNQTEIMWKKVKKIHLILKYKKELEVLKPPCFIDEVCQGHSSSGGGSWSKEGSRKRRKERGRLRCLLKFNKDL